MKTPGARPVTVFFAGDVMTGRGIDQILEHPSDPELRESHVEHAATYVELAERAHGSVPRGVRPDYIWGDGIAVLERQAPAASIVNLETSVTVSDAFQPGKAVHYRMHPDNVGCLKAAKIDVCTLANNHVLDFGERGLLETLAVLRGAGLKTAGAGRDLAEAQRPARVEIEGGAGLLVFAFGSVSSGISPTWAATRARPGVNLLDDLSPRTAGEVAALVRSHKRPGDIAVASIHWGSNWGHELLPEQVEFSHRLTRGGVDVLHGHSSHHLRRIEVYEGKLILYGCGDLVTDYEGILGGEVFRGDLGAMYFATLSPRDGTLVELRLVPTRMERMRLTRATGSDARWLLASLNRISGPYGARFEEDEEGALVLRSALV